MDESSFVELQASRERSAATASGWFMLFVALVLLGIAIATVVGLIANEGPLSMLPVAVLAVFCFVLSISGFYVLQPNQAAAILLFGAYRGTDRATGLRWVWPWMSRRLISVRANNVVSEALKVNDRRGNPIEIAAQVVWRVSDTAQALFDIDDYRDFVIVQIEAAVRTIGSAYAYDDMGPEEITLRGHHEEVNAALKTELKARLAVAGLTVDECGLTHLAYAPEIAGAMLRRQQAEAVVAARQTLVSGAVSMVELALDQLSTRGVVELDDERRAAMVSNLMVVLCGERDTQPIVNAGTLYQ